MRSSAERGMLGSGWHVTPSFPPALSGGADAPAPPLLIVVVADAELLEQVLGSAAAVGRTVHVIQSGAALEALMTDSGHGVRTTPPARVKVGPDIWFDTDKGELVTNEARVSLTPSEEEVLNVLLQHQTVWLKAYQIANKVALQLERDDVSPHSVETIISTLRAREIPIHNKYGRGYRLMLVKELSQHAMPE